jgi:hypothetical protein
MSTPKASLKQLKSVQTYLGGRSKGYFITMYGNDIVTGKSVDIEQRILRAVRKNASADYYLVKGKLRNK